MYQINHLQQNLYMLINKTHAVKLDQSYLYFNIKAL